DGFAIDHRLRLPSILQDMLLGDLPSVSFRGLITTVHGMAFGGLFLLAFTGGLVAFISLGDGASTADVLSRRLRFLRLWVLLQAFCAWLATLVGALAVYP